MPNLAWLPSWLAPLTDRKGSPVQALLQRTSIARFRNEPVPPALRKHTEGACRQLFSPGPGPTLPAGELASFDPDVRFFRRRIAYLDKFITGCESILETGILSGKLICSRYTAGLPDLGPTAVREFRDSMSNYRDATAGALIS